MKIKICGIANSEDAINVTALGPDAIGLIFYPKSSRYISVEEAERISLSVPPFVNMVGVFVNQDEDEINEISTRCRLDLIQLHGNESPEFCLRMPKRVIKAFPIKEPDDVDKIAPYKGMISAALLDTKVENMEGGTGKTFDWGLAIKAKEYEIPIILAGGINSENVTKAVQLVNPYAVDLSSSVEIEPGKKDYHKVDNIISIVNGL